MLKRPVSSGRFLFLNMTTEEIEKLKYPLGAFSVPEDISAEDLRTWINEIAELPAKLEKLVSNLDKDQLDTPYRPEGWTVKQLVHHIADAHMNALLRFKWALSEDSPTIKAYDEKKFADLPDSLLAPAELSLNMIKSVHGKWVILLENMSMTDYERTFTHPQSGFRYTLKQSLANYAWHGTHHFAHLENLIKRKGW